MDNRPNCIDLSLRETDCPSPATPAGERPFLRALADGLTLSRVGLAGALVLLGAQGGQQALPWAVAIIIAGWTADSVDGHLARMAGGEGKTIIGRNDVTIDVVFTLGGLAYFALAGYVSRWLAFSYVAVASAAYLFRPARATAILLQVPGAIITGVVTFVHSRHLFRLLALWALTLLVLDRKRFIWRLERLRHGVAALLGQNHRQTSTSEAQRRPPQH